MKKEKCQLLLNLLGACREANDLIFHKPDMGGNITTAKGLNSQRAPYFQRKKLGL